MLGLHAPLVGHNHRHFLRHGRVAPRATEGDFQPVGGRRGIFSITFQDENNEFNIAISTEVKKLVLQETEQKEIKKNHKLIIPTCIYAIT